MITESVSVYKSRLGEKTNWNSNVRSTSLTHQHALIVSRSTAVRGKFLETATTFLRQNKCVYVQAAFFTSTQMIDGLYILDWLLVLVYYRLLSQRYLVLVWVDLEMNLRH